MNIVEAVVLGVLIVAVAGVVLVALRSFKNIILIIEKFKITFICREKEPSPNADGSLLESPKMPQDTSPRWIQHWRAILIGSAFLFLFAAPVWWWAEQPDGLRWYFTRQLSQTVDVFIQIFQKSVHHKNGQATLDELTRTLENRAEKVNDSSRGDEIWIVNHYWQYWNTAKLQKYLELNKLFVANGGKIHRMFVLSNEELQSPDVQAMLHAQCQIGQFGDEQAGNGFELWRADPETVKGQEEYKTIARQFARLHGSDESFENFDVVRFKDTVYYSSDFSTDHRLLGSSTWTFDKGQVKSIDLRPLFQRHIAEKISCDSRADRAAQQVVSVTMPQFSSDPI